MFVRAEHWFARGYWIALPCRVQVTQSTRGHLGLKRSSNQFTCDCRACVAAFKPGCLCREGLERFGLYFGGSFSGRRWTNNDHPLDIIGMILAASGSVREPPLKAHRPSLLEKQAVRDRGMRGGRLLDLANLY